MKTDAAAPKHQIQNQRGLKAPFVIMAWIFVAVVFQLTPWPGWPQAVAVVLVTSVVCVSFFYLGVKASLTPIAWSLAVLLIVVSLLCGWRPMTQQDITLTQLYRVEIFGVLAAGLGFTSGVSRAGNSLFTRDGAVGLIALLISVASTVTFLDTATRPENAQVNLMMDNAAPPSLSTLTYRAPGTTTDKDLHSLDGSFSLPLPYPEDTMPPLKTQMIIPNCQAAGDTCLHKGKLGTSHVSSYSWARAVKAFVNVVTLGTVRDDDAPEVRWSTNHSNPRRE